jgi:apolipoprotein N-acyltransferase
MCHPGRLRPADQKRRTVVSFALYLMGFMIFIAGVAWALDTAGIPRTYNLIACVILFGVAIFSGATRTRQKDTSA